MVNKPVKLLFEPGNVSADDLEETIDEILADLRDPLSDTASLARKEGLDPAVIGAGTVTVEETDQGIGVLAAAILVGIAIEVTKDLAILVWKKVIAPEIERRRDGLAIGEEIGSEDDEIGNGSDVHVEGGPSVDD
jgi:hypothetical protein